MSFDINEANFLKYSQLSKELTDLKCNEINIYYSCKSDDEKLLKLKKQQKIFWGHLVKFFHRDNWILKKIDSVLSKAFSGYREAIPIEMSCRHLKIELTNERTSLKKIQQKIDNLIRDNELLLANKDKFRDPQAVLNLMMEACGGKEAYEHLPELDLGDRQGKTDYIDFIKRDEITAPVMKFKDNLEGLESLYAQTEECKRSFSAIPMQAHGVMQEKAFPYLDILSLKE